jgi:hypothetical protein
MRKFGGIAVVAAALLLLAGCTSSAPAEDASGDTTVAPTVESAPITAEPKSSSPTPSASTDDYLLAMHAIWQGDPPSDDELVSAGTLVCENLRSGKPDAEIVVVVGSTDDAAANNTKTVTAAKQYLCPEFF